MNKQLCYPKVCTGCGHILGKGIPDTALACCPDHNFVPLEDFIDRWKRESIIQAHKIFYLKQYIETHPPIVPVDESDDT